MRTDGLFLAGLGLHLPAVTPVSSAVREGWYSAEECEASGWTGAAVAGSLSAPDLAVLAARQAVERSGLSGDDFAIVVHACTYHQGLEGWIAPTYVQRHTIGGTAPAIEVRGTCTAALSAMEIAYCYLSTSDRSAALISCADNFSGPQMDRWRYAAGAGTNRLSIFGDAGTAVVLSRRTGFARVLAVGSASLPEFEEMYRGDVPLYPPQCTIGEPVRIGARIAEFTRRAPAVVRRARAEITEARTQLAKRTLEEAGISAADVTRVTHVFSGGEPYIRSVLDPLGIDPSLGVLEFGRGVGHLGASDHFAALHHLLETRQLSSGDRILMLGNGVGVTLACAVLEIV
ncbi:hypothetical protein Lesp02_19980 [Lentzea sp. NBRC 105346]|uniref:ketoacyl-ACP synthase III family protein n=1 Tax=Lentzea sp. NBRC 105346 TaxID=3032205 RepID=UPI0024A51092|nr:ketoacyl-ACP synthase III family protein [Lentzea sp. NBRC 105346]GLZ29808.1 hypothetical protein Lesp02_19980 [Lentzea sp. NBRC 105346]